MKKIILIINIMFLFLAIDVNAQEKTTFNVNSVSAKPGDEVTISISMNNNPKFQSLSFFIPLNSIYVEFKSCSIIGFKKATMKDCDVNPRNEITFYALQASDADNKLFADTGNILEVKLKVKDDVKEDIPLNLDMKKYAKSTSEQLEYEVVNGIIKITGDFENTVVDSKEDLSNKVKEDDVTWSSSNDNVAQVDENGKVTFNESGSTTITAKNKNGKTIYEKTYSVDKEDNKYINIYIIIGIVVFVVIIIILSVLIIKNRKSKK